MVLALPAAAPGHPADPGATGSLAGRLALEVRVVDATRASATVEVVCRNTSTRPATLTEGQDICRVVARRAGEARIVAEGEMRVNSQQGLNDGLLGTSSSPGDALTAGPNRSFGGRATLGLPGPGRYELVAGMPGIAGLRSDEVTVDAR
jgi:hypothetical protein